MSTTEQGPPAEKTTPPGKRWRLSRLAARLLLGVILAGMIGWSVLALYYSNLPDAVRPVAAGLFGIASGAILLIARPRRRGPFIFLLLFAMLIICWLRIPASNDRDWQPDVAVLPWAEIAGNVVTIHNIRNCDYRTETDFDVHHYSRSFDLDKLYTADLYVVYWGSPMIAHTMLSFGFDDDRYVCVSIETRKEKGEDYSTIKGFFRQYELTYVVGDERDLVRLRTNYRGEDVYLYRLNAAPDVVRGVFLSYLRAINSLKDRPEWYNALTTNCTTTIRGHTSAYARRASLNWKLIINGYLDEMAYGNGALDQSLPFAELKKRSHINERAKPADKDLEFSKRIREGLPGCENRRTSPMGPGITTQPY